MDTVTVTVEALTRLGTCVLLVDEANCVEWMSERLRRLMGSDCAGRKLEDLVASLPHSLISLLLRNDNNGVLPLRGDWLSLNHGGKRVFVGSPAPETTEEMTSLGIGLDDYLEHDSWLSYLIKSDEAISTQKDAVERIDQLKLQHAKLTEVRNQMDDARKAGLNMMLDLDRSRTAAESATRSKSEFLANMSHEIRTPMTAILGFTENLLDPNLSDSEKLNTIHTVRRNGEHLLQIINDILDISKIEAGKLEVEHIRCSPVQLIADVKSLMQVRADAKNLPFNIEYFGAVPETIESDPTRLKQILVNLLGNAIKFTAAGGVHLVTRFLDTDPIGGTGPAEPMMQFDIVDSGIGMTPEQASKLFQAFAQADSSTTRKFGGTGLGLNISKRLAEMLGGDITFDSTLDEGSTFHVTVTTGSLDGVKMLDDPATATIAQTQDAATLTQEVAKLGCRILLAEDNATNRVLVKGILKKLVAEVTAVENGKLAVGAALTARDAGKPFDVVLMDMQMPVMDGYEATGLLRHRGYTYPIIALTAHAMASDRQKCRDTGCDDYASKPIDRKTLIETICRYLDKTQVEMTATEKQCEVAMVHGAG